MEAEEDILRKHECCILSPLLSMQFLVLTRKALSNLLWRMPCQNKSSVFVKCDFKGGHYPTTFWESILSQLLWHFLYNKNITAIHNVSYICRTVILLSCLLWNKKLGQKGCSQNTFLCTCQLCICSYLHEQQPKCCCLPKPGKHIVTVYFLVELILITYINAIRIVNW